jgi:hypothetical protein
VFRVLVDTCVWLDLAKDPRQHSLLGVVEQMARRKLLSLLVPTVVIDEFKRNRDRIAKESERSLSTHFKLVKEAVGKAGGDKRNTKALLAQLDDVDRKIPLIGGIATTVLDRVESLLTSAPPFEASQEAKLRAADRALHKKAPFHRDRNSIADALIIEAYRDRVSAAAAGERCSFVTHNKADFSDPTNFKSPHVDFKGTFSRIKSLYFINLAEALRRIDPSFVTETMLEYSWDQEPRGLSKILTAEDLLMHQVWYNRHWNRRIAIEEGKIKLVDPRPDEPFRYKQDEIVREIWQSALKAATRVEKKYGKKNLGPWDDFEWGMINGKLSALRWVLGDEWDMLDT